MNWFRRQTVIFKIGIIIILILGCIVLLRGGNIKKIEVAQTGTYTYTGATNYTNTCTGGFVCTNIAYNDINNKPVNVVVFSDKLTTPSPVDLVDVLVVYHGTVDTNDKIEGAAKQTLAQFKNILSSQNKDMLIISVAYPEGDLLMGDNVTASLAALDWALDKTGVNGASKTLGVNINKVFIAGHSQGGYTVVRLNSLRETAGVIANAPGPIDLVYRCGLDEATKNGKSSKTCVNLYNEYGSVSTNPNPYKDRSLSGFTNNFKSDILLNQGMQDDEIQIYLWPGFKQQVKDCTTCKETKFVEVQGKHASLFVNPISIQEFNTFISTRR
jgi:hypothetical protein